MNSTRAEWFFMLSGQWAGKSVIGCIMDYGKPSISAESLSLNFLSFPCKNNLIIVKNSAFDDPEFGYLLHELESRNHRVIGLVRGELNRSPYSMFNFTIQIADQETIRKTEMRRQEQIIVLKNGEDYLLPNQSTSTFLTPLNPMDDENWKWVAKIATERRLPIFQLPPKNQGWELIDTEWLSK